MAGLLPPERSLLAGPLTVQVFFNEDLSEEIAAGQLGPEDVVLTNKLTQATIAPTAVSYDPPQNKVTMTFPFIDEALYELTLISGDGAFEDARATIWTVSRWDPDRSALPAATAPRVEITS